MAGAALVPARGAAQGLSLRTRIVSTWPQANAHDPKLHQGLLESPIWQGLYPSFDMELQSERAVTGFFAVVYLNLGGFTLINDQRIPPLDDGCTCFVAECLHRAVRREDTVRYVGDDEFACQLTRLPGRERLSQLARKMLDELAALFNADLSSRVIRPSIGIAVCRAGVKPFVSINQARNAMCHARQQQIGFAFFEDIVCCR